ncbi:TonB-dependent receptor plug domain-containing protein [Sphingomonas sp. Leaf242]|uniref:TonB-dependent receptor plug domain-containing protein n=1 Tax=Sphingomonas sp. Leaf242 TaxID=1736304 RepID=UPI0007125645|nr:TonB-dependent receptor plug domain-containing protein [Sphingomonas sp. Leaf242]KQO08358.1 TonB-dependent receptor [Sphingomonas sp. Leaf242]
MRILGLMLATSMPTLAMAQQAPAPDAPASTSTAAAPTAAQSAPSQSVAPQSVAPAPAPAPAATEAQAAEQDEAADLEEIVVTGSRKPRGSVIGDIPPDQTIGQSEIRSYGVSSISDLLSELSPQTTSGRGSGGAPVVLLNGRRISSFSEIRDIPTEAIQRVEILPEEVALKYGYRADQKVVNFVLRRRFRAVTVEGVDTMPTEGGSNAPDGKLDLLSIARDRRVNLHAEYTSSSALTEAERDIVPTSTGTGSTAVGANGAVVDPTPYRTLQAATDTFTANSVYARNIFGNVGATINARLESTDSRGLNGLPIARLTLADGTTVNRALDDEGFLPLAQRVSSISAHLGTTLNGDLGTWRWNVTGNYDRSDTQTFTDTGVDSSAFQARLNAGDPTANPFARLSASDIGAAPGNRAYATQNTGEIDAVLNGTVFNLPAGAVSTTIKLGGQTADFDSRSYRAGLAQRGQVSRDTVDGQVNIDVPISSRGKDVLPFLGTLSANFNLAEDHLSDLGTLTTLGYGANWSPIDGVRLIASVTDTDEAPTAQQLGNPSITTPNVRIFDYVRGTTATVTTISGGNPALVSDNNHVRKLGLTLKPWSKKDLSFTANYVSSRVDNPIAAFPSATASIEAAFPDRFTRDASGNLLQVDSRPINFARSERSELRWGINFSAPLKSKIQKELEAYRAGTGPNPFEGLQPPGGFRRPDGAGGDGTRGAGPREGGRGGGPGGGGPGGGGPGGGGGRFGGGGRGQAGGRLQFAFYHTWHFTDRVLVADGGPSLNLLNGDAIGSSGGQSRHELEAQAGYSNNGVGVRLSAQYASGTRVNGGTLAAPETLNFGGLATANARLFADLGQRLEWVKAHPWLRGMRVSLAVTNILNTRQRVTDATGATPNSYQPDYLDPLGRTVRLSIRKLFF